jgi:hypothetical protein
MTAPAIDQSQQSSRSSGPTKTEIAATLIAAYVAATVALRARVSMITAAWFGAEGYRTQGVESFVNVMVPTLNVAQQTMADLTSAYLTQQIVTLGGGTTAAVGIPSSLVTGSAIRGVDPAEVLRRPYEQLWTALSQGKSLDQAIKVGEVRAQSISMTNLQLAKTAASHEVMSRDHRVLGYRRVLTGAHSCGLCIIASSQRYHKADLMPIHPSCDCAIAPIVGTEDPGRSINSVTLAQGALMTGRTQAGVSVYGHDGVIELGDLVGPVHDAIQERFGQHASDARTIDYRKVLITHQHGEYGPTLAVASHSFTDKQITSGDLSAPKRRPKGLTATLQVDRSHELPASGG